jgi:hypothetical protein
MTGRILPGIRVITPRINQQTIFTDSIKLFDQILHCSNILIINASPILVVCVVSMFPRGRSCRLAGGLNV